MCVRSTLNPENGLSFKISIDIRQHTTFGSKVICVRTIYTSERRVVLRTTPLPGFEVGRAMELWEISTLTTVKGSREFSCHQECDNNFQSIPFHCHCGLAG